LLQKREAFLPYMQMSYLQCRVGVSQFEYSAERINFCPPPAALLRKLFQKGKLLHICVANFF
jgi:hypothetical protein